MGVKLRHGLALVLCVLTVSVASVRAEGDPSNLRCVTTFAKTNAAPFYANQLPILIRDERDGQQFWGYADACVAQPGVDSPGYSSLFVPSKGSYDFPYKEFPDASNRQIYLARPNDATPYTSVAVPDTLPSGLPSVTPTGESMTALFKAAGFIVADAADQPDDPDQVTPTPKRVYLAHSRDKLARDSAGASRTIYVGNWEPVSQLICNGLTDRPGDNESLAYLMAVRGGRGDEDRRLPFGGFHCPASEKQAVPDPFGGGMAAFYLFPNLKLTVRPEAEWRDGKLEIHGAIENHSSLQATVKLFYATSSTPPPSGQSVEPPGRRELVWHPNADDPNTNKPRTITVAPRDSSKQPVLPTVTEFSITIPQPSGPYAYIWALPDQHSGLVLQDPDPANFSENQFAELTMNDNWGSVKLCDLTVNIAPPPDTVDEHGLAITVVVHRQGCDDLSDVGVQLAIDGDPQQRLATFHGSTATVVFETGSFRNDGVYGLVATVDPANQVTETNERNNDDHAAIAVHTQPNPQPAICPLGVPLEKCFMTRLVK